MALGQDKGYVTLEELHGVLPSDVVSPDHIEELTLILSELDINLAVAENLAGQSTRRHQLAAPSPVSEPDRVVEASPHAVRRTDDPVRMYLREMRTIPLLTREAEVEIAQRIEQAQCDVVQAIIAHPVAVHLLLSRHEREGSGAVDTLDPADLEAAVFDDDPVADDGVGTSATTEEIIQRLHELYEAMGNPESQAVTDAVAPDEPAAFSSDIALHDTIAQLTTALNVRPEHLDHVVSQLETVFPHLRKQEPPDVPLAVFTGGFHHTRIGRARAGSHPRRAG